MDTNETRNTEETRDPRESVEINRLRADEKIRRNQSTRKVNRLWMWLAIIILVFILFWVIFSTGAFESLM